MCICRAGGAANTRLSGCAPESASALQLCTVCSTSTSEDSIHVAAAQPGIDTWASGLYVTTISLWSLQLGAVCSTATSESTTHVVAAQPGTDKAIWARGAGKAVVSTSWLLQSGTFVLHNCLREARCCARLRHSM